MTALEIRIIAYGLVVLGLMGFGAWSGYRITANHYQAVMARDRAAQDKALAQAQADVIATQKAQQTATAQAEQQYETLKASYDGLGARLADSVRELTAIHSLVLSKANSTAESHGAGAGASGDSTLAGLSGQAVKGCLHDAAELTGLQTWANGASK